MRVLWIEDGGGNITLPSTAIGLFSELLRGKEVFESPELNTRDDISLQLPLLFERHSLHEIVICKSYAQWLELRENGAIDFDVALIDINLEAYPTPSALVPIEMADFDKKAGLYIYQQLVRDECFPEELIAIFTGEPGTLADFVKLCQAAMIPRPTHTFEKKKDDFQRIRQWLADRAAAPYATLRRGIIDGCRFLRQRLAEIDDDDLERQLIYYKSTDEDLSTHPQPYREEVDRYLYWLETFLPLHRPPVASALYLRFIGELVSKWSNSQGKFLHRKDPPPSSSRLESMFYGSCQRLLKNLRNRAAHDQLPQTVTEAEVAYCFLLSARALLKLDFTTVYRYEQRLVQLFDPLPEEEFTWELEERLPTYLEQSFRELHKDVRVKPAVEAADNYFLALWQAYGNETENHVGSLRAAVRREIAERSFELAYQSFWHGLFPLWFEVDKYTRRRHPVFGMEPIPEGSFPHLLGRHILSRSFAPLCTTSEQPDSVGR